MRPQAGSLPTSGRHASAECRGPRPSCCVGRRLTAAHASRCTDRATGAICLGRRHTGGSMAYRKRSGATLKTNEGWGYSRNRPFAKTRGGGMCFSGRSKQLHPVAHRDKGGDLRTAGSQSARASAPDRSAPGYPANRPGRSPSTPREIRRRKPAAQSRLSGQRILDDSRDAPLERSR